MPSNTMQCNAMQYIAQSMKQFIRTFNGKYARVARKGYNKLFEDSIQKSYTLDLVNKFINKRTLYPALNNIIYGWLKPKLDEVEKIRLSVWCSYYGMDASERTIPIKFGSQLQKTKFRLNASCNHICCDWGYHLGYTRLLEKAGERYEVILVQQLANTISLNMPLVKKCPDFHIKLSLDNATNSNVDNVRNCIVQGIQSHLQISSLACQYINNHGVIFDLRDFRITVEYIQY